MKTKEIDLHIQQVAVDFYEKKMCHDLTVFREKPAHGTAPYIKCKLIIEIPEKKIEITESQFDEAVESLWSRKANEQLVGINPGILKQKLFGRNAG